MDTQIPDIQEIPHTSVLKRRPLAIARLVWAFIVLLTMLLFVASVSYRFAHLKDTVDLRPLLELGTSAGAYATYVTLLDIVVFLAHVAIALFIFIRRPDDWMALFVSMILVINGCILPLVQILDINNIPPSWLFLDRVIIYIGLVSSMILLYVFPDGRFVPRLTILLAITWVFFMFFAIFLFNSAINQSGWNILLELIVFFIWAGTGMFSQAFRYENVSLPIQRQQTKWALLGLSAAIVGPILVLANIYFGSGESPVPNLMYQRMGSGYFTLAFLTRLFGLTFFKLASLLFPISFAIAILRYRLWDIDIIIRRTLIYVALSGALILIYLASIVLLQQLLSTFTRASQLAVVISTLATAALFNPLRRRIQYGIDRRFYRNRYDAEKILAAFSASLRDQVDLDQLQERLLVVVEDSMHPESVSLWLAKQKLGLGESKDENND